MLKSQEYILLLSKTFFLLQKFILVNKTKSIWGQINDLSCSPTKRVQYLVFYFLSQTLHLIYHVQSRNIYLIFLQDLYQTR